ncbi:class F sortase [Paenibacillus riograndensis]|uniref:class F sortase n=1 Tax=Paenibacillus riograndensis TaxID=483937 RepID=UPI0012FDD049|nr:class F sortase [Paenibacillus riograndensis]
MAFITTAIVLSVTGCAGSGQQMDNRPDSSTPRPLQTMPEHLNPAEKGLNEYHAVIDEPKPFMPDLLTIPAISVKAGIQPVGLLENGQMDVPDNTEITGILFPGVLPGGKGNVIIDGHVDSYSGPAVFFKLKKLKQGDKVIVSRKNGRQLTYIVESVEAFTPAEAPMERIFGETGERRMNLITCTGRYSRKKKEHEKRLIIFTKLDGEL